jgi:Tfp pilus assembly protein PilO
MTTLNRVMNEKRRLIVPLAIAAVANLAALGLIVYPLSRRVASSEERAAAATQQLTAASLEYRGARATLEGRQRTDKQLDTFYVQVLPRDQAAARHIAYLRLAQLAREANLDYSQRAITPEHVKGSTLSHLTLTMGLEGEYRDIRQFIHTLETSPDFIVIESIVLGKPQDVKKKGLTLALKLATYYRAADADERER